MSTEILRSDALIVVDPQVDFCPGGALAVAGGDEVIPLINQLTLQFEKAGATIVVTQDWHTKDQISFASNHGLAPFTETQVSYGAQTLWPDHCVQGTPGSRLHPGLDIVNMDLLIRKGANPAIDSYSAFMENDHTTSTGLSGYLKSRGIKRVFLVGLAYDYCVGYSALDAVKEGFEAVIITDATRAIDLGGTVVIMEDRFKTAGVSLVQNFNTFTK